VQRLVNGFELSDALSFSRRHVCRPKADDSVLLDERGINLIEADTHSVYA